MQTQTGGKRVQIILLSVAGGLVGALPAIASIFILQYIFGVLYAFVPLAAYWAYKRAGGDSTRRWALTPLLASIAGCAGLLAGVLLYQIYMQSGLPSVPVFFSALAGAGALPAVVDYSVDAVLFLILGIWLAQRYIFGMGPARKNK